ncbi:MAG: 50S ribosomal protein L23 [Bacteroidota bacterium]
MNILKKPHLTPKSAKLNSKGKYTFVVDKKSNKTEIKKAVEKLYSVSIASVNTMNYAGENTFKHTKKGVVKGQKAAYKKAILTLAAGSSIDVQTDAV